MKFNFIKDQDKGSQALQFTVNYNMNYIECKSSPFMFYVHMNSTEIKLELTPLPLMAVLLKGKKMYPP
jgi:hypothetical protein